MDIISSSFRYLDKCAADTSALLPRPRAHGLSTRREAKRAWHHDIVPATPTNCPANSDSRTDRDEQAPIARRHGLAPCERARGSNNDGYRVCGEPSSYKRAICRMELITYMRSREYHLCPRVGMAS